MVLCVQGCHFPLQEPPLLNTPQHLRFWKWVLQRRGDILGPCCSLLEQLLRFLILSVGFR